MSDIVRERSKWRDLVLPGSAVDADIRRAVPHWRSLFVGGGISALDTLRETAKWRSLVGVGDPTDYPDPSGWTLIQQWRVADGDMAAIDAAFNARSDGRSGIVWSPDGTRLTLGSFGDDSVRTFSCSTPFDPDTASLLASRNVTNPGHLFTNDLGTIMWYERSNDTTVAIPISNHTISANAESSSMTKAQAGFSGSSDVTIYPLNDFSAMYIDGPPTDVRRIDFSPNGDLDSRILGASVNTTWTQNGSIKATKLSQDGTRIYRAAGSQGIEVLEMSTPFDVTTMTSLGTFAIPALTNIEAVFINPADTSEVWVSGNIGRLELARLATNV